MDRGLYQVCSDGRKVILEFPPKSETDEAIKREMKALMSEIVAEYVMRSRSSGSKKRRKP